MAQVTLSDVNKSYGAVNVVQDVNLSIADNEFLVLVGPSGCGKSTTLRMVAGLESITSGTIQIGARTVNDLPPKDRDIAMVFQNYALYQHMTIYDNLAFGLRNRRVPEDKIKVEVERATEILGLGALLTRKPKQLSGGQQQRVALGRCIVRHPQVFLFDEPLSNLDAKLRAQMRIELKRLRERVPTTSIYVTHDQVEAMTLGDRVVVMKDGFIQQVGTPLEIYNTPRTQFVASFIGSPAMNFLNAELADRDGVLRAIASGLELVIPPAQRAVLDKHASREVVVGIRPEHIALASEAHSREVVFSAPVEVTEQLGSEMLIGVRAAGTLLMVSGVSPQAEVRAHDTVQLRADMLRASFFDRATGDAIQ
jgi:multiple sugar transport system ATP-binding protein